MSKSRTDTSYLHPRIRAIETPCPCSSITPRTASLLSTGGLVVVYLLWAIGTWWAYFGVDQLKAFVVPASSAFDELRTMSSFTLLSAWYFSTVTLLAFLAFVTSIFPRAEVAKHLSRILWVFGWIATWFVGIYGLAAHLSADAWISAGCDRGDPCDSFRRRLQIWMLVALFTTLALVFWFNLAYSSFVHTLHPDIFHTGDVDSELDEYDHARLVEEELRRSDHPLAPHALEWLRAQSAPGRDRQGEDAGEVRRRKAYQTGSDSGSESSLSESESDGGTGDLKDRKGLIEKRPHSRAGSAQGSSSARQGRRGARDGISPGLSSSSEGDQAPGEGVARSKSASLSRSRSRSRSRSSRR